MDKLGCIEAIVYKSIEYRLQGIVYILWSIEYRVQSIEYKVQSRAYRVQSIPPTHYTLYTRVQSQLYIHLSTVYILQSIDSIVCKSIEYRQTIDYTKHSIDYTLYSRKPYTLQAEDSTLYALHPIDYTLYSIECYLRNAMASTQNPTSTQEIQWCQQKIQCPLRKSNGFVSKSNVCLGDPMVWPVNQNFGYENQWFGQ